MKRGKEMRNQNAGAIRSDTDSKIDRIITFKTHTGSVRWGWQIIDSTCNRVVRAYEKSFATEPEAAADATIEMNRHSVGNHYMNCSDGSTVELFDGYNVRCGR